MVNTSSCEYQAHPWRHWCVKCKKQKNEHKLSKEDVKKFESVLSSIQNAADMESKSHHVYAWLPPEIPHDRISQYFNCFPQHMVPEHDSPGLLNHMKKISSQIPLADLTGSDGRSTNSDCVDERVALIKILGRSIKFGSVKEWEEGMPEQCRTCNQLLEEKELVVISKGIPFHPVCFICCVCKEQLTELIHCHKSNGDLYCVRHYSENFKKRCHACDELIFEKKFVEVGSYYYHHDHLCCFECDEKLVSNSAFEKEGQIYCNECYQKMHSAAECDLCGKIIGLDCQYIKFEDKCWHSDCFKCSLCGDVLERFEKLDGKFYCEKCYKAKFFPKCLICEKPIEERTTFIKYEGKTYHTQCFCCADCKEIFDSGTFLPHDGLVYCKGCYLRNFGTKCCKCQYAITDEQVLMYKEKPFHLGCFICSICSVHLGKKPLKLVGEKTYCLNCFADTFCKSCHSCKKPIVLKGKDVLYSYENFNWHASCFICHSCEKSLVNRTFIFRGTTLVCKDCAVKAVAENKQEKKKAK